MAQHIGITEHDTPQGWHVVDLAYQADPAKRAPDWAEKTRKLIGITNTAWDREFERDWNAGLGDCYFGADIIKSHYQPKAGRQSYRGYLEDESTQEGQPVDPAFWQDGRGCLEVWALPVQITCGQHRAKHFNRYCIGADVAEGLEKRDWSSAHVIDRIKFELVAEWHGHPTPAEFAVVLDMLGRYYGEPELHDSAFMGVEANNHGHAVIQELLTHLKYTNLYFQEKFNEKGASIGKKAGWTTTTKTKPLMIDHLTKTITEKELVGLSPATCNELLRFVQVDGKLGAAGSGHDDRVMSLAIALQMHAAAPAPTLHKPKPKGWRGKLEDKAQDSAWIGA